MTRHTAERVGGGGAETDGQACSAICFIRHIPPSSSSSSASLHPASCLLHRWGVSRRVVVAHASGGTTVGSTRNKQQTAIVVAAVFSSPCFNVGNSVLFVG